MSQVVPCPGDCCAAATVIEVAADFVWTGLPLSLTAAVKLDVPVAVGVPEITPVVAARVRPAGRPAEAIHHEEDQEPPLACQGLQDDVPLVPPGSGGGGVVWAAGAVDHRGVTAVCRAARPAP